jgi:hypothetical protein
MLYRIIFPAFLFEMAFFGVIRFDLNVFNYHLLAFNILFVLWLMMESVRVPLSHTDNT